MEGFRYEIVSTDKSIIRPGDTIIADGHLKTVCSKNIHSSLFMGVSIFGYNYWSGTRPVSKVNFLTWKELKEGKRKNDLVVKDHNGNDVHFKDLDKAILQAENEVKRERLIFDSLKKNGKCNVDLYYCENHKYWELILAQLQAVKAGKLSPVYFDN